jgi:tRNA pseudouridine55 synthase
LIFNLYKHKGETPLECIQRFIAKNPEHKKDKWTYAGRLDPMADGVLLACTGEDIAKKEGLTSLDKEYEFVALLGFATDSFDCLGKILRVERLSEIDEAKLTEISSAQQGEKEQKYPEYSSKVQKWNRRGEEINPDEIPTKNVKIYEIKFLGLQRLTPKELLGRLLMDISKIKGDFRQNEIMILWKQILNNFQGELLLARFSAKVSSGTYIRSTVNDLGNTLGFGACALSITRTKVGDYKLEESVA